MRFNPRVCGERQRVEILRAQGLPDLDHDHAGVEKKTMRNSGSFRKRPQPADGPVTFLIVEHTDRTRHEEPGKPRNFSDPSQVSDDGAAIEEPHGMKTNF